MSLNPRDYDLDELRRMARERGDPGDGESGTGSGSGSRSGAEGGDLDLGSVGPGGESAAGSLRQGLYRELMPLSGAAASKPYLEALPDEYAGEQLVFEWLEFLLMSAGYRGATNALDYYESIGWITAGTESALQDYLIGLDDTGAAAGDLDVDDHLLSLVYVAKLASMG